MTLEEAKECIGKEGFYPYNDIRSKVKDVHQMKDGKILAYLQNGTIVDIDLLKIKDD